MSLQLVSFNSCLNVFLGSALCIILKTKKVLSSILGFVVGAAKQMVKQSEMSLLKIVVLKLLSIKELVRI